MVAWARTEQPVTLRLTSNALTVDEIDLYGGITERPVTDFALTVTLPGTRCDPQENAFWAGGL
ncbi:hypothetical protein HC776_00625, partial [bacterium]|nr:hypothetical protein [bacterium]